jgi:hypothetical protein
VSSSVLRAHQLCGCPSLQNVPAAHWLWLVQARRHLAPMPLPSSMHASPLGHPAVVHEGVIDDEHAGSASAAAAKSSKARRKAFGAMGRPCSMT